MGLIHKNNIDNQPIEYVYRTPIIKRPNKMSCGHHLTRNPVHRSTAMMYGDGKETPGKMSAGHPFTHNPVHRSAAMMCGGGKDTPGKMSGRTSIYHLMTRGDIYNMCGKTKIIYRYKKNYPSSRRIIFLP